MSGIAGIFYRDGRPAEQETIDSMVGAMAHRGPDGIHTWREGSVALGHCMLHTTPESLHDKLPMESRDGNLVLTADARIDNREDLMRLLELRPENDRPVTDCDLIMAAYRKWGKECPNQLIGAFAFVIWDKAEKHLFCARDHFGIKPLFYRETNHGMIVATDISTLKKMGKYKLTLDLTKVADHLLAIKNTDDTVTYYNEIRSISSGSYLICSRDDPTRNNRYWSITASRKVEFSKPYEWYEQLRHRFKEAVHDRLRSHNGVGSLLSGGLDSSSTTAIALRKDSDRVTPLTFVFDETHQSDEREFARAVLDMYDKNGAFINMDPYSPLYKWNNLQSLIGHPVHYSTARSMLRCIQVMRRYNLSVLITGYDGDTTISHGKGYLHDLIDKRRYVRLVYEVSMMAYRLNESIPRVLRAWIMGPIYKSLYQNKGGITNQKQNMLKDSKWFTSSFSKMCGSLNNQSGTVYNQGTIEHKRHVKSLQRPLLDETTTYFDVIGSFGQVEVRHPFFDKRLIELCISVPGELKLRHGWSRYIARKSFGYALPSQVKWRRDKNNFEPALINGLLKHERVTLEYFRDNISDTMLSEWLRVSEVAAALDSFLEDPYQLTEWRRTQLWRALAMFLWLKSAD